MGLLNSARYIGFATGPFLTASILRDRTPPNPLYMYSMMAAMLLIAAITIYQSHVRHPETTNI